MLIAKKPCSFGGNRYFIGDEIPEELVECPELQESRGVLTVVGSRSTEDAHIEAGESGGINVRISGKNGTETVCVSVESLARAFELLQVTADEAAEELRDTDDGDLLLIMDACDSRKAVRSAARARIADLKEKEAGDA